MDQPRRRRSRKASRPKGLQVTKRNGHWHVYGTVNAGGKSVRIRLSLGLPETRPVYEAEEAAREAENRAVEELIHGKKRTATFAHACARYLEDRATGRDDEWRDPERPAVQKLAKELAHSKLTQITTPILQGVITKLYGHTAASNQARVCSTLGGILSTALRHGLMDTILHIPRPKGTAKLKPVNKWLYPDEIGLLLNCVPLHLRLPIKIMFLQGRRPSEILYREWNDLDLRPGRERLDLGVTKPGHHETIALDAEVVDDLKALAAERRAEGLELNGNIFLNARGEPWHNPEGRYGLPIHKPVRMAREQAAGVMEQQAREADSRERREWLIERAAIMRQVTAYWGRHNFVSHHVAGQTAPLAIAEMVGWTSLDMLNRYGHLSDGHLRSAMDNVRVTGRRTKKKDPI